MALTFKQLEEKLSPKGKLKTYDQELSVYINKNVKGKTKFVISELVGVYEGISKFVHKSVTEKEYVEHLKEKFKDEKDDDILFNGC